VKDVWLRAVMVRSDDIDGSCQGSSNIEGYKACKQPGSDVEDKSF